MNRLARVLFALGLLLSLGRTATAQSHDSKEGSGTITGHVTVDGKPARRITVMAKQERSKGQPAGERIVKATTDEDGRFRLSGLTPGQYVVAPSAPSLVAPEDEEYYQRSRTIAVSENQAIEGIDFALERGGVITGRVTDPDGRPVIGEVIGLIRLNEDNEKEPVVPDPMRPFSTDDRGVYRVYGVAKGRYIVSVSGGAASSLAALSGRGAGRATYYPGITDESKATLVEVGPGSETTGIDISLPSSGKGYEVRGHVVDFDTGKPITGVIVSMTALKPDSELLPGPNPMSRVGPKGEFTFSNIMPGQYQATAHITTTRDYCSGTVNFELEGEDIKSLEIKLHRSATVSGVVALQGGNSDLFAKLTQAGIGVDVRGAGEPGSRPNWIKARLEGLTSQIGADGAFGIQGLKAGKATFLLGDNGESSGLKIMRVERGGVEQSGGLDIQAGEAVTDVRVVIAQIAGTIKGHVVLEGGVLPQEVYLYVRARPAASISEDDYELAEVDSNGAFLLQGLLPGTYELTLSGKIRPSSGGPSEQIQDVKQTVSVTDSGQVEVVFNVSPKKNN